MKRRGAAWAIGTPVRLTLVGLIRLYRATVGLLLGGRCRFYPSCSAYAEQAIAELGVGRGVALAVWRVLRCGPWTAGGIDYPPTYDGVITDESHLHASDDVIHLGRPAPSEARS